MTSHEVSDSRQLGLSGAREGGPSTKSMWHGSKEVSGVGRCQQEPTKEPSNGSRHSVTISPIRIAVIYEDVLCERAMKDFET